MSAQHTPIELSVIIDPVHIGQAQIISNWREAEGDFDERYVSFNGYFGPYNPSVFSAAPDLLEALEDALEHIPHTFSHKARAAINRAKGIQ